MKLRMNGGRLWHWALPLACLLPLSVSARVELSAGNGRVGDGDPSGDPLDSNDYGSGGGQGGGTRPDDPRWPGSQSAPWRGPVIDGRRVLLIPINQGGLLTFRLVITDKVVVTRGAVDAR